jgi:heat shock protein HslJ
MHASARFVAPLRRLLVVLALTTAACMPIHGADGTPMAADPAHDSRNSLDVSGVYEGVLSCADCGGVRTRLVLDRDQRYELGTQPFDPDGAARVVRGRFVWLPGGNAIALERRDGGQRLLVGEGRVALLEPGTPAAWPQPPQRVLQRVAGVPSGDVRRTLESHRWTLTSATGGRGEPIEGLPVGTGRALVLGFAEGRLNVEGGCNRLFGGYRIEGGTRLVVSRMASTMMACEPAAMKVDGTLAGLLAAPVRIELASGVEPVLRLVTAADTTLSFAGRTTPEARYGPPARMFLEVAAQTVACTDPGSGATECLRVRERHFDAQGLAVGAPGAWRAFGDPIDGYVHEPGVRTVLRLKRFERDAASVGSRFLFVLDLVVESERVADRKP